MPWMSESDICEMYKYAKNPKSQINILAQLNGCSTDTICRILQNHGFLSAVPRAAKKKVPRKAWSVEEITQLLHLIDSGLNNKALAKHFNRTVGSVIGIKNLLKSEVKQGNIKQALDVYHSTKGASA